MLNLEKIKMDYCVEQLNRAYRRTYSNMEQELGNVIIWSSHLALEIIANSDALYHNVEHTVMVTLAGQSILEGKHLVGRRRVAQRLGAFRDRSFMPRYRIREGDMQG